MALTRRSPVRSFASLAVLALLAPLARAATYTVTNTADSGAGSLRQAVADANGNPGADTIAFNIPGGGVHTIDLGSEIDVTDPVVVDGYTQSGSSPNTDPVASNAVITIEIRAANGYLGSGINVTAGKLEIHGVAIHDFLFALELGGGGSSFVGGCFIGLTPAGVPRGNQAGVFIQDTAADAVGDGTPANRNVISGGQGGVVIEGTGGGVVKGNLIGTDPTGIAKVGNSYGVYVTTSAMIGGATAAEGNVISGNTGDGIRLDGGSGAIIEGNRIGLDGTGLQPLGNGGAGVYASTGSPNINHNFVSANASHGIDLSGSTSVNVSANYIGSNVFGTGELGNGGAGVHSASASGTINGNWIAHNQYGLWIESEAIFGPPISWSANSIFDNRGLGIVEGNPPGIGGPAAVITSIVPNASTTTINGFIAVPVGMNVGTGIGIEFFSSPACSKRRPGDFDEGKTFIGNTSFNTDGSPAPFSAEVPVVITDEVVTATAGYTACFPFGEGGCVPQYGNGPFSQRLPYSITPASGDPAGGTQTVIAGANFEAGATVVIGGVPLDSFVVVGPAEIDAAVPPLPAGSINDVTVANPDGSHGTIPSAYLADFLDVPPSHVFHDYVRTLVTNAVAVGGGNGNFGVDAATLRAPMAVFLLKAKHGICYTPPPCAGAFADVTCPSLFADWIEALAAEGITGGCGGGNYCPTTPVRRDQMAAFLLKAEHGSTYVPPPCAGVFSDVACPSIFADWIEQLANEGVTGGCGSGNYCPSNPNTRGQMAVFLTKTFKLQ